MEKIQVLELLYNNISETMTQCGFAPEYKEGARKTGCSAYERGEAVVMDFSGDKGVARFVFSEDRIHKKGIKRYKKMKLPFTRGEFCVILSLEVN